MRLRDFGRTGMKVSEVGFGGWGIGGSYGAVERREALDALARAEELGCNFIDTAAVYADSELVIGEFLPGRRDRWILATKYSGQKEGFDATLESQLKRLGTDYIDFYQVHWAPGANEQELYEALYRAKKSGKARAVGVSLYTAHDIDYVLDNTELDGFQVKFSLLDPEPFLMRLDRIRERRPALIVRSALREGFLTGKYKRDARFTDPNDQRSKWTPGQVAATVDAVERFRFLEAESGSMVTGAARYPLSFAEVSTVILGTKSRAQADSNFGVVPGATLSPEALARVAQVQKDLGLTAGWSSRVKQSLRRLLGR
jgi:aryl-alcohol dehydrogenase-like predicted oxidoreductase